MYWKYVIGNTCYSSSCVVWSPWTTFIHGKCLELWRAFPCCQATWCLAVHFIVYTFPCVFVTWSPLPVVYMLCVPAKVSWFIPNLGTDGLLVVWSMVRDNLVTMYTCSTMLWGQPLCYDCLLCCMYYLVCWIGTASPVLPNQSHIVHHHPPCTLEWLKAWDQPLFMLLSCSRSSNQSYDICIGGGFNQ